MSTWMDDQHVFTQEEQDDLNLPDFDDLDLETDEAIAASVLIGKHLPEVVVDQDRPNWAIVTCRCGIIDHVHTDDVTDHDSFLVPWMVHVGVELERAGLLRPGTEER